MICNICNEDIKTEQGFVLIEKYGYVHRTCMRVRQNSRNEAFLESKKIIEENNQLSGSSLAALIGNKVGT